MLAAAAGACYAKRPGESPFPEWSREEIDQILTKSPWAHEWKHTLDVPVPANKAQSFLQFPGQLPSPIPGIGWPGGGTSRRGSQSPYPRTPSSTGGSGRGGSSDTVRIPVEMIIRWASALPVRRAMALHEFGRNRLDEERAQELLNRQSKDYIIELTGIPRAMAGGGTADIQRVLQKNATLYMAGHRPAHPASVDLPPFGATVTAAMHFPRWEDVTTDSGEVEFSADLGRAHIKETFKLKLMTYEGRLEL